MTDKKALEVLKSWLQLAYHNPDGTDEDSAELYEALQTVFALITRQQSKIDKLKTELKAMRGAANSLKMHYEKAQAEIERLRQNLNIELEKFATEYDDKIKAEAYKEFAERLKENWQDNDYYWEEADVYKWIDNLLKELVGDDNA